MSQLFHLLKNRLSLGSAGRDAAWVFAQRVFSAALNVAVAAAVARYLGPKGLGVVAAPLAIAVIMTQATNLGLSTAIVRFGAPLYGQDRKRADLFISFAFWMKMALAVTGSLLVVLGAPLIAKTLGQPGATPLIRLVGLGALGLLKRRAREAGE